MTPDQPERELAAYTRLRDDLLVRIVGVLHADLLVRIVGVLHADLRVRSAWLCGSFGRGEADAWSDFDLHVAVEDDELFGFWAARQSLCAGRSPCARAAGNEIQRPAGRPFSAGSVRRTIRS